jgi:hypothetical protein
MEKRSPRLVIAIGQLEGDLRNDFDKIVICGITVVRVLPAYQNGLSTVGHVSS